MIPLIPNAEELVSREPVSKGRQALRFILHLLAVYLIVWFCAPWIAGRFYDWFLPLLHSGHDESRMQFMFSHLFAITVLPGLLAGFINSRYRHKVATFVWTVPALLMLYKLIAFPTSVFEDHWSLAFHYYFAGGFVIAEAYSYRELFGMMGPRSDLLRGVQQLHTTGLFYASLGYSLAAWLGPRARFHAKLPEHQPQD